MIPYSKQTWVDGSAGATPISASRLTVIEQGISDSHQMPACRAYNSIALTASTSWTTCTFDSENFDTASGATSNQHDLVTNNSRLTCRYNGIYFIAGYGTFATTTGTHGLLILLNGTTTVAQTLMPAPGASQNHAMTISAMYQLNVNDYVELQTYSNPGSISFTPPAFMFARLA